MIGVGLQRIFDYPSIPRVLNPILVPIKNLDPHPRPIFEFDKKLRLIPDPYMLPPKDRFRTHLSFQTFDFTSLTALRSSYPLQHFTFYDDQGAYFK